MTKPKAQTLQQRLGFVDDDLKTPKHDELMLWLNDNIGQIVNNLFNKPLTNDEITSYKNIFSSQAQSILDSLNEKCQKLESINEISIIENKKNKLIRLIDDFEIPLKPQIKNIKKRWELPVTTSNYNSKFTIGFIDFVASFNIPILTIEGLKSYILRDNNIQKVVYHDFDEQSLKFKYLPQKKTIFIEVKTTITSLGELIRQINQYKTYLHGDYYVLCPDSKHKDLLEQQGINFIEYKKYI